MEAAAVRKPTLQCGLGGAILKRTVGRGESLKDGST